MNLMTDDLAYSDIRPFRDHEIRGVIKNLLSSPTADLLIKTVFPELPVDLVKSQLREINTIKIIQLDILYLCL